MTILEYKDGNDYELMFAATADKQPPPVPATAKPELSVGTKYIEMDKYVALADQFNESQEAGNELRGMYAELLEVVNSYRDLLKTLEQVECSITIKDLVTITLPDELVKPIFDSE